MKNVLITGANSGIGLEITKKFIKNNYNVFAHYRKDNSLLKQLDNNKIFMIQSDFETDNGNNLYNSCLDNCDGIDILINNASTYSLAEDIESIDIDEILRQLKINVFSAFVLTKLSYNSMKKNKWGRIINISTIGLKYGGNPLSLPYNLSKSCLEQLTMAFAKIGGRDNILVNTIRVGVTNTKFHKLRSKEFLLKRSKLIPLKRPALASEIAETIYFIASEYSSYISGSTITVSGGE